MATAGRTIPAKLHNDAIIEAIVEIRFEMAPKAVPEIFFGRLAEYKPWVGFEQRQLAAYQIPAALRRIEPNFRHQPLFELIPTDKSRAVRVGPQVLSYHRFSPYVGWAQFRQEIADAVEGLFSKSGGVKVNRLGLRYLNALRGDLHQIRSVADLDLQVSIGETRISGNLNVNFNRDFDNQTGCTVRIATPEFVKGKLPSGATVYIDVDVFNKSPHQGIEKNAVLEWVEFAHTREKEQFFSLLTDRTINSLKEY